MNKIYINFFVQSILLIFLQVVLFNNVRILSFLLPILYSYPLLKLPIHTERWLVTLLGAVIGISVDVFMNTPGLNMASFTLVGYFRNPILHFFSPEEVLLEQNETLRPFLSVLRPWKYFLYLLSCVFLHVASLFLLESFSTQLFVRTLPYILGSTVMTLLTFLILETFSRPKKN